MSPKNKQLVELVCDNCGHLIKMPKRDWDKRLSNRCPDCFSESLYSFTDYLKALRDIAN